MAQITAGFYKYDGERLLFAPTAVHFPDGTSIYVSKADAVTEAVNGWQFFESDDAAYAAAGVEKPAPVAAPLAAGGRRAGRPSREERESLRAAREAERIARLEKTNPQLAEQVKARSERRAARLAARQSR